jgi:nucleoside-diphosphate-sugar epimerase
MRIFLAGASGVIGVRLVPLLVAGGHGVAGMTPGTYSGSGRIPPPPRIHIDQAARRTIALLDAPSGVVVVAEDQ